MLLYLLRHAEAIDAYPDPARVLTPKGRGDAEALGRHLARQNLELPFEIWSSPYARAQETARLLVRGHGSDREVETREGLTPDDDPIALLPELAAVEDDLLLVGHNPHLAILAGQLLGGSAAQVAVHFRKCTLMRFERVKRSPRDTSPVWVLDWMLAPKLFRRVG
ncbi:MAG: SixA phosphatase family protein [Opitutales bacterium]